MRRAIPILVAVLLLLSVPSVAAATGRLTATPPTPLPAGTAATAKPAAPRPGALPHTGLGLPLLLVAATTLLAAGAALRTSKP